MRQGRLGEEVVRDPVGELRQRVRGARRHHEDVGAGEVQVDVLVRRPPRERGEGLGPHEALRARRDEGNHVVPCLHEKSSQLT